jgi:hypothetical protein
MSSVVGITSPTAEELAVVEEANQALRQAENLAVSQVAKRVLITSAIGIQKALTLACHCLASGPHFNPHDPDPLTVFILKSRALTEATCENDRVATDAINDARKHLLETRTDSVSLAANDYVMAHMAVVKAMFSESVRFNFSQDLAKSQNVLGAARARFTALNGTFSANPQAREALESSGTLRDELKAVVSRAAVEAIDDGADSSEALDYAQRVARDLIISFRAEGLPIPVELVHSRFDEEAAAIAIFYVDLAIEVLNSYMTAPEYNSLIDAGRRMGLDSLVRALVSGIREGISSVIAHLPFDTDLKPADVAARRAAGGVIAEAEDLPDVIRNFLGSVDRGTDLTTAAREAFARFIPRSKSATAVAFAPFIEEVFASMRHMNELLDKTVCAGSVLAAAEAVHRVYTRVVPITASARDDAIIKALCIQSSADLIAAVSAVCAVPA